MRQVLFIFIALLCVGFRNNDFYVKCSRLADWLLTVIVLFTFLDKQIYLVFLINILKLFFLINIFYLFFLINIFIYFSW